MEEVDARCHDVVVLVLSLNVADCGKEIIKETAERECRVVGREPRHQICFLSPDQRQGHHQIDVVHSSEQLHLVCDVEASKIPSTLCKNRSTSDASL